MDGENEPLIEQEQDLEETPAPLGNKKRNVFCIIVFLIGVAALSAALVTSYFLYFKYVIGKIS